MEAGKPKTVLVVDDEKHLREIVRFDMRKLGHRILEAENGQQAFQIVGQENIDLVISDVRMPVATGVQLLKELRNRDPGQPPFVFMTAFADISSEEALALGAEAFLRKPLGKQEIVDVVTKSLVPKAERWMQGSSASESARRFDFTAEIEPWETREQSSPVEIGQGGLFLPMSDDFPAGFEILRFKVDSGDEALGLLEGVAQVRWVRQEAYGDRQAGIGVEFLHLEEKSRIALSRYLQAKRPIAYIPLGNASK